MKSVVLGILALSLASAAAADSSYMPIAAYTDKTGVIYGLAAFAYQDGRPGYENGIYGVTNGRDFHSLTMDSQRRSVSGTDLALHAVLEKTFDNYYGEGDQTSVSDSQRISENVLQVEASGLRKLPGGWSAGPVLGIKARNETRVQDDNSGAEEGRAFKDSANPALGLRALWDTRDSTLSSQQGNLIQIDMRALPAVLGLDPGASDAWQAQAEGRHFNNLGHDCVLAQRLAGGASLGTPGYEERYQLGGTHELRGFQDNRFRGNKFYCLQEELRLPVWRALGAALSADMGDTGDAALEHPRASVQAGLRLGLPPSYGMKARLDFGVSDGGDQSLALQFGQTF